MTPTPHSRSRWSDPTLIGTLILGAAALRLVSHPPNFTPVLAIALFGGAHFATKRLAVGVPLLAMFVSDLVFEVLFGWGLHQLLPVVYGCMTAAVAIGFLLRGHIKPSSLLGAAVGTSLLFFVVTNFAVWLAYGRYPVTVVGLVQCYVAAVPFFGNTLLGTLTYSAGLFGSYALISRERARSKSRT